MKPNKTSSSGGEGMRPTPIVKDQDYYVSAVMSGSIDIADVPIEYRDNVRLLTGKY